MLHVFLYVFDELESDGNNLSNTCSIIQRLKGADILYALHVVAKKSMCQQEIFKIRCHLFIRNLV